MASIEFMVCAACGKKMQKHLAMFKYKYQGKYYCRPCYSGQEGIMYVIVNPKTLAQYMDVFKTRLIAERRLALGIETYALTIDFVI